MLTTPHALVGILLMTQLPPFIGALAAFASHFALDFFLPHWNPHLFTEMEKTGRISRNSLLIIVLDGSVSLLLLFYFVSTSQSLLPIIGAGLATLPDWIEIPFYFFKIRYPPLVRYVTFEHNRQARANPFFGLAIQVLLIALVLWLLLSINF